MKDYRVYAYLIKEGTKLMVKWFGEDFFLALCNRAGVLPVGITPAELLDYFEKTYSQEEDQQKYLVAV